MYHSVLVRNTPTESRFRSFDSSDYDMINESMSRRLTMSDDESLQPIPEPLKWILWAGVAVYLGIGVVEFIHIDYSTKPLKVRYDANLCFLCPIYLSSKIYCRVNHLHCQNFQCSLNRNGQRINGKTFLFEI